MSACTSDQGTLGGCEAMRACGIRSATLLSALQYAPTHRAMPYLEVLSVLPPLLLLLQLR